MQSDQGRMTTKTDPHHPDDGVPVVFVSLEGLIGAGKSTIVKAIGELGRDDVVVVQEPVSRWCAPVIPLEGGAEGQMTSLLEAYYKDERSVAMAFQMYAMFTRVQQLSELASDIAEGRRPGVRLVVAERCSWSDYELFGRPMKAKGLLSDADWFVYTAWFESVTSGRLAPSLKPSGYAFLSCPPDVCMARIASRARPGEDGIDRPYLEALDRAHVGFFDAQREKGAVDVLILDGSAEGPEAVESAAERIVEWGMSLASSSS